MTTVTFPLTPLFQFRDQTTGELLTYQAPELHRFLETLWRRTGADDDSVEDVQNGELYETGALDGRVIDLIKRMDSLEVEVDSLNYSSRISELEKKINELEISILMHPTAIGEVAQIKRDLKDLQIDIEMNYGT